ncbi:hypothetical protein BC936DRAFT_141888 [Jimgerdemannia flammicorona]|uniref:Uncharacterized protein n=1 Tax=Jimgerdemannia flammicorona TaxID=994334 RepID=A0A433DFN7_9FUNG|nr:hypothetical protein BC936DRAFT_141888 [Jimgerdemannia flammicorona]
MKSELILEKGFKICKAYIPGDSEDGEVHLAEPVVKCELSRGTGSNSLALYYCVRIASSVQFKNSTMNFSPKL